MADRMTVRYYLDTAIWRDFFEDRKDRFRPLGEWATMLINEALSKKCLILYSDIVIEELKTEYSSNTIQSILSVAKDSSGLFLVETASDQAKEATALSRQRSIPFGDAMHAILARDNNAIMITRDKHFLLLTDIVEVRKPEDLI